MESKEKLEKAEKVIQAERVKMERAIQEQTDSGKELERLKIENERQVWNSVVSLSEEDKDRKCAHTHKEKP